VARLGQRLDGHRGNIADIDERDAGLADGQCDGAAGRVLKQVLGEQAGPEQGVAESRTDQLAVGDAVPAGERRLGVLVGRQRREPDHVAHAGVLGRGDQVALQGELFGAVERRHEGGVDAGHRGLERRRIGEIADRDLGDVLERRSPGRIADQHARGDARRLFEHRTADRAGHTGNQYHVRPHPSLVDAA